MEKAGSPPHTRGKGNPPCRRFPRAGITPAHAGKRTCDHDITNRLWDHPRTRGEKSGDRPFLIWFSGSPPHTRGKEEGLGSCNEPSRITPAHAGKSFLLCRLLNRRRDHPRTRGEKPTPRPSMYSLMGSPPHTRGKGTSKKGDSYDIRITPAHAGKRMRLQAHLS